MSIELECRHTDISDFSIASELELTDLDADRRLLDLSGISLLVFTSEGCARCRYARSNLSGMQLPVARVCWIDAGHNAGLVARYEVFHLPAMFVVRDGLFLGELRSTFNPLELTTALNKALQREPDELP